MSEKGGVLLIDDDRLFAREVEQMVPRPQSFTWLDRSESALDEIRAREPSLILVDLDMPRHFSMLDEEEGLEVIDRLPVSDRSRVIVVTGRLSAATHARLTALGVTRIYLKSEPVSELSRLLSGGS